MSPEPNKSNPTDSKVDREQKQRVEKVREVDPDEQARQQKRNQFKAMMDADNDKTAEEEPRSPSPYETQFYESNQSQSNLDQGSVPSPPYSPPPDVSTPPAAIEATNEDLPQSNGFWSDVDLPDQPIQPPTYQDDTVQPTAGPTAQKGGKTAKKELEPSPFGPPGKMGKVKASPQKHEAASSKSGKQKELIPPQSQKVARSEKEQEEKAAPVGRYWTPEGEQKEITNIPAAKQKDAVKGKVERVEREEEPKTGGTKGQPMQPSEQFESVKQFEPSMKQAGEKKGDGPQKHVEIVPPSTPHLPAAVEPIAMNAAVQATPYLSPEVLPLFYQMVGSILVMSTRPGVSRTEVTLNSPAFASSKFYGSTIEIIKYSTAPDSLNIRLSGSNEAVTKFNQNIPSLLAAFQNGNFKFRIGRLDAVYSAERPVFRRKDQREGGEMGGDFGGDKKGKQR
jgi:hypothetical protein